jgi:hypothetical protein
MSPSPHISNSPRPFACASHLYQVLLALAFLVPAVQQGELQHGIPVDSESLVSGKRDSSIYPVPLENL